MILKENKLGASAVSGLDYAVDTLLQCAPSPMTLTQIPTTIERGMIMKFQLTILTGHRARRITKILLILLCAALHVGCNDRSKFSEYAKAMSLCVTMERLFKNYEKEFGSKPSGVELKAYLKKNGVGEHLTTNWIFGNQDESYVAYNVNVATRSGSLVTIIFYRDGKHDTLGLKDNK